LRDLKQNDLIGPISSWDVAESGGQFSFAQQEAFYVEILAIEDYSMSNLHYKFRYIVNILIFYCSLFTVHCSLRLQRSHSWAAIMAARSTILFEYPVSLSYQDRTLTMLSTTYVVGPSTIEDKVDPLKSVDTSGSSL
jgi:hypothetical protein